MFQASGTAMDLPADTDPNAVRGYQFTGMVGPLFDAHVRAHHEDLVAQAERERLRVTLKGALAVHPGYMTKTDIDTLVARQHRKLDAATS